MRGMLPYVASSWSDHRLQVQCVIGTLLIDDIRFALMYCTSIIWIRLFRGVARSKNCRSSGNRYTQHAPLSLHERIRDPLSILFANENFQAVKTDFAR